jgi:tRNA U38,U39,U40 pseudouridine synthase TruA
MNGNRRCAHEARFHRAPRRVLAFHFTADGFLYRMVRNLVGALVKVGLGKITVDDFGKSSAPVPAPKRPRPRPPAAFT